MTYVADTCVLIWYLTDNNDLPAQAPEVYRMLEEASRRLRTIYVSTISLVELIYLSEKGKIPRQLLDKLLDQLTEPGSTFRLHDLTGDVALALESIKHKLGDKLDMPDRIIAATALERNCELFTSDGKLRNSTISCIWR
jgi:PIN domain nuclease of toxin-antitoxin system